eukprot:m.17409 g.17409  ORF g.17409 m.17409 type:complete len:68 (-) comp9294_c0_seq2:723-926(-)
MMDPNSGGNELGLDMEPPIGFLASTGWMLIVALAAVVSVFNVCRRSPEGGEHGGGGHGHSHAGSGGG